MKPNITGNVEAEVEGNKMWYLARVPYFRAS
ncbi:MAG: hypothetical protein JWL86_6664 [Rhizobium sp.]|nr:hypothetical protein [Rhizobium sp.]